MNSWIKALLAGLMVAILVFLFADKLTGAVKRKKLYNIDYSLSITPNENRAAKTLDLKKTLQVLEKRMLTAKFEYTIHDPAPATDNNELRVKISLRNMEDTIYPYEILRSNGLLQVIEIYRPGEVVPFIEALTAAALKAYPPAPAKKIAAEAKSPGLSEEINELIDSIDHHISTDDKSQYGLALLFKPSYYNNNADFGMVKAKDTAAFGKLLRSEEVRRSLPEDASYGYGRASMSNHGLKDAGDKEFVLYLLNTRGRQKAFLQNEDLVYAIPDLGLTTGRPSVTFQLSEKGSITWENLTRQNVGRPVAIIVNGEVISAPQVSEPITGGHCTISGAFSMSEAKTLAALMASEPLPALSAITETRVSVAGTGDIQRKLLLSLLAFAAAFGLVLLVIKTLKST